jgi:hypothetical protein
MIHEMKTTESSALSLCVADRRPADRAEPCTLVRRSNPMRVLVVRVALLTLVLAAAASAPRVRAPTTPPPNCTASSDAAVQRFVANAVTTGLTQARYGMTLAQFQAYGVAATNILQTDQTYLVLVGLSGAIADALPPANADGT